MFFLSNTRYWRLLRKKSISSSYDVPSISLIFFPSSIRSLSSRRPDSTLKITIPRHDASIQQRFYSETNRREKSEEVEKDWSKEYHTIPNYITISRIAASPLLTYAVIFDYKMYAFGGVLLFGFTDWLDGYLAKKLKQQSTIGAFLDPLADKVMIGSLTLGLLWKELIPFELGALIVSRDVFLALCSIVLRYIDKPAESGFWDVSSATFRVVPTQLSKVRFIKSFIFLILKIVCVCMFDRLTQPSNSLSWLQL